ncbi:transcriptional regulator NanR [Brucella intermedia]|uniref:transcriptional regulator NanR n=1 Tax=Brucella intermedia TaxID=94625 RepID=UPI00224B5DF5|nr:transcriptional regulator NanR [Brucella intermedia]
MPSFTAQPIKRRKIYEDVVEALEGMMLRGELRPGDAMPSERELMENFEVGRTSIREALFALQKMGLISVRNGERAFVTQPSPKKLISEMSGTVRHMLAQPAGLREFQDARILLESALARAAALQRTEEQMAAITKALEQNKRSIGDLEAFAQTDVAFHYSIISVLQNTIFIELHAAVYDWLSNQRAIGLQRGGADMGAFKGHKAIHDAIKAQDPDKAEAAMRKHLSDVNENYWTVVEAESR